MICPGLTSLSVSAVWHFSAGVMLGGRDQRRTNMPIATRPKQEVRLTSRFAVCRIALPFRLLSVAVKVRRPLASATANHAAAKQGLPLAPATPLEISNFLLSPGLILHFDSKLAMTSWRYLNPVGAIVISITIEGDGTRSLTASA